LIIHAKRGKFFELRISEIAIQALFSKHWSCGCWVC